MSFVVELFLATLCRHAQLFALVPVPLGHLVRGHVNARRDLHLRRIRPARIPVEVISQDVHLVRVLAHTPTWLPLFHVVMLEKHARLCNVLLVRHGDTRLLQSIHGEGELEGWVFGDIKGRCPRSLSFILRLT